MSQGNFNELKLLNPVDGKWKNIVVSAMDVATPLRCGMFGNEHVKGITVKYNQTGDVCTVMIPSFLVHINEPLLKDVIQFNVPERYIPQSVYSLSAAIAYPIQIMNNGRLGLGLLKIFGNGIVNIYPNAEEQPFAGEKDNLIGIPSDVQISYVLAKPLFDVNANF